MKENRLKENKHLVKKNLFNKPHTHTHIILHKSNIITFFRHKKNMLFF